MQHATPCHQRPQRQVKGGTETAPCKHHLYRTLRHMGFSQRYWSCPLFSFVTSCILVYTYQRVRGVCRMYLQGGPERVGITLNVEASSSSEAMAHIYTNPHGVIFQTTTTFTALFSFFCMLFFITFITCFYYSSCPLSLVVSHCYHYDFRLGWRHPRSVRDSATLLTSISGQRTDDATLLAIISGQPTDDATLLASISGQPTDSATLLASISGQPTVPLSWQAF
jgi:hypothetical protein